MSSRSHSTRKKVAVLHQGCIPVYREAFFRKLAQAGNNDYVVIHGDAPSGTDLMVADGPFDFPNLRIRNKELSIAGNDLIYQPVLSRFVRGEFDGAVIGHEVKYLSNLAILAAMKAKRRPVIWWGFGYHRYSGNGSGSRAERLRRLLAGTLKSRLTGLADGFLVYTNRGADCLKRSGFPEDNVSILHNTIDLDEQVALHSLFDDCDDADLRRELGLQPSSAVLVFLGRLIENKRIHELIEFVEWCGSQPDTPAVEAVIIGSGEMNDSLRHRAAGLPNVHFVGALLPTDPKGAKILRVASALVIPGFVGLAVNHAFAHCLPVITRDHTFHSPEVEYIKHGVNGLLIPGDKQDFFRGILSFVRSSAQQRLLSDGACESRKSLSMDHMVAVFDDLVSRLLDRKLR